MLISDIKVVSLDGLSDHERVDTIIKNIILTYVEQIPGSRGFGLRREFLDHLTGESAENLFLLELQEAMDVYLPGIEIREVEADFELDGGVSFKIHVEGE